jgi:hypothetical protein
MSAAIFNSKHIMSLLINLGGEKMIGRLQIRVQTGWRIGTRNFKTNFVLKTTTLSMAHPHIHWWNLSVCIKKSRHFRRDIYIWIQRLWSLWSEIDIYISKQGASDEVRKHVVVEPFERFCVICEKSLLLCSGNESGRQVKEAQLVPGLYRVSLDPDFDFHHVILKIQWHVKKRHLFVQMFNRLLQKIKSSILGERSEYQLMTMFERTATIQRNFCKHWNMKHDWITRIIRSTTFALFKNLISIPSETQSLHKSKNTFCWHIYKQPAPWDLYHFASPNHVIQVAKPFESTLALLKSSLSDFFFAYLIIQYLIT